MTAFFGFLRSEPDAAAVVFCLALVVVAAIAAVALDILYPNSQRRRF